MLFSAQKLARLAAINRMGRSLDAPSGQTVDARLIGI